MNASDLKQHTKGFVRYQGYRKTNPLENPNGLLQLSLGRLSKT